jgi:hypothetical protein
MVVGEVLGHRAGSATSMGCQYVRKHVSARDLNPVTSGVGQLAPTGKQITAGQRHGFVSEGRLATYVHDRHRPEHVICPRWCPLMSADRVIRSTTGALCSASRVVAAVGVLRHAYDLVQAHDEAGWTALRYDSPAVLSG